MRVFLNYHIAFGFKKAKSDSSLIVSSIEVSIMRRKVGHDLFENRFGGLISTSKRFHPKRDFKTDLKTLRLKYPLGITPIHICLDILNINSCGRE